MSHNSVCAIILAAGKGSRMKSSTPKILQDVAGLPIIGHILKTVQKCHLGQTIVVLNKDISLNVLPQELRSFDIAVQHEQKGTADAVLQASMHIHGSMEYALVLYGDTPLITSNTIINSIEHCRCSNADIDVLAIREESDNTFGKLQIDDNGCVQSIVESCDICDKNISNLCNVGMIIKVSILNELLPRISINPRKNEFFLTDLVGIAYKSGKKCVYNVLPRDEMIGVNTMFDLSRVESIFQNNMRKKFLENGVKMVAPETVFFSYDTEIESDVTIYPYVVFGTDVHIKSGTQIESFCHIRGADIDSASVGPFSRLRPGTQLNQGVKVGNFVEIKNSVVKSATKINHLSYIGDANIGYGTNVGAGTITCNYDGYQKFVTNIGDNVFIGSNVSIIAPITIENRAIIGAGSAVSKCVKQDSITLTRAEQKSLDNAAIKYRNKRSK